MSWLLCDYECEPCGVRWESLEERPAPARVLHVACGKQADRIIGAPMPIVASARPQPVSRAKSDPLPPRACDTTPLADGTSFRDWKKGRRKMWRDQRYAQIRKEFG